MPRHVSLSGAPQNSAQPSLFFVIPRGPGWSDHPIQPDIGTAIMQLVFNIDLIQPSDDRPAPSSLIPSNYNIFVVSPFSWPFLAALIITEFSKGFANKLGEETASLLLNKLGIIKDQNGDIKEILEALSLKITRDLRSIILTNEIRREHANLSAGLQLFEEYLLSPNTRQSDLGSLDARAGEIFHQLRSLGVAALPATASCCGLRMAVKMERFRITGSSSEAGIAKKAIAESIDSLKALVSELETAYQQRVIGPTESDRFIPCRKYPSPDDPARFDYIKVKALEFSVDGVWQERLLGGCFGPIPSARQETEDVIKAARDSISNEFFREYLTPLSILENEARNLTLILDEQVNITRADSPHNK